jgi:hypothetical protein
MIVEPVPTNPRGPARSALRVFAIALPAVFLLVVVGIGVLGPRAQEPTPAPSPAAARTAGPSAPVDSGGPVDIALAGPAPAFPVAVANLRARSVADTLGAHEGGHGADVVAIAGFLRTSYDPASCPSPVHGLPAGGCEQRATLSDAPRTDAASGGGGFGVHVHGVVPRGVEVPAAAVGAPRGPGGLPVVVIGRFPGSEAGCTDDFDGCEEPFVIERVAWADGERLGIEPQIADSEAAAPTDPMLADTTGSASAALGPTTTLLRVALVNAADVGGLDALAGDALGGRAVRAGTPTWYVRGLDVPYDPLPDPPYGRRPPRVRWAVIDATTWVVLARGSVPTDTADPGAAAVD